MELLSVMGLVAIIAAIYLGVIAKAFLYIKNFVDSHFG